MCLFGHRPPTEALINTKPDTENNMEDIPATPPVPVEKAPRTDGAGVVPSIILI